MHQIQSSHTIKLKVGQEATDLEHVKELLREAETNRAKVIAGACSVENDLAEIIASYFYAEASEKREDLRSMILDSDWCSFGNKRKLVEKIIGNKNLLQGKEFTDYQKLLANTMKLRNSFAHGQFLVNRQVVSLSFYQDKPQIQELTEAYLQSIEKLLRDANEATLRLVVKMGARNVLRYGFNEPSGVKTS